MTNTSNDNLANAYQEKLAERMKYLQDEFSDAINNFMMDADLDAAPSPEDQPAWDDWFDRNYIAAVRAYLAEMFGTDIFHITWDQGFHISFDNVSTLDFAN